MGRKNFGNHHCKVCGRFIDAKDGICSDCEGAGYVLANGKHRKPFKRAIADFLFYAVPIFIVLMIFGIPGFFVVRKAYKQPPVTHENILVTITDKKRTNRGKAGGSSRFYFDDGQCIVRNLQCL